MSKKTYNSRSSERESFLFIFAVVAAVALFFSPDNSGKKNFFQRCWQAVKDAALFTVIGVWVGAGYVGDKLKSAAGAIKNFFSAPEETSHMSTATPISARTDNSSSSTLNIHNTLSATSSGIQNTQAATSTATVNTTPAYTETSTRPAVSAQEDELTHDLPREFSYSPRM